MAKWYPAKENFLLGLPVELTLSLINTSSVKCAVQYYKFDMAQIDFPSCKVNSKPCKRILEPTIGIWDGFVPTVYPDIGESEEIPLYLNNYWLLNQTGTYEVTCVINLDVSLSSRKKHYNFGMLSATNKVVFEIENSTTNDIINCLNEYLADNGSIVFLTAKGAEAIASLKNPITIEYLKKGMISEHWNSSYWASKGLIEINTPESNAALVWSLTNGTSSAKENVLEAMKYKKHYIPEALPIIRALTSSSNKWTSQKALFYLAEVNETNRVTAIRSLLKDKEISDVIRKSIEECIMREESNKYPVLQPKDYKIIVAPSHIVDDPNLLFKSDAEWKEVQQRMDVFNIYDWHLIKGHKIAKHILPKTIVDFSKKVNKPVGIENGGAAFGFQLFTNNYGAQSAERVLKIYEPVFEKGGELIAVHLDGPFRRLLNVGAPPKQKLKKPLTKDESIKEMVNFYVRFHNSYPKVKLGLISNLPNWDYSNELRGFNGDWTKNSDVYFSDLLNEFYLALTNAGEKLAFFEVDSPYQYYVAKKSRDGKVKINNKKKFTLIQKWCKENNVPFYLLINYDSHLSEDKSGKEFYDGVMNYIKILREDSIFPDVFILQSWYKIPAKNLPESEKYTFMNTTRDAIRLINAIYPK